MRGAARLSSSPMRASELVRVRCERLVGPGCVHCTRSSGSRADGRRNGPGEGHRGGGASGAGKYATGRPGVPRALDRTRPSVENSLSLSPCPPGPSDAPPVGPPSRRRCVQCTAPPCHCSRSLAPGSADRIGVTAAQDPRAGPDFAVRGAAPPASPYPSRRTLPGGRTPHIFGPRSGSAGIRSASGSETFFRKATA